MKKWVFDKERKMKMIKLSKTEEVVVREIFKEVSGILDSKVKLLFANKDDSGIYLDLISNEITKAIWTK